MLKQRIQDDMKAAMKAADKRKLGVIRLILAAIKQREVDERSELDDNEIEVRDLGKKEPVEPDAQPEHVDDGDMTIAEYSLEMMKHIYSTWRRRPRR